MSRASYVAEMNLSASISRSNWWQLACWSVDDFITGPSPSPYWISANGKPTGTPNGGSFRRGPLSQIRVLIEGARKSYQRPLNKRRISAQQTAGRPATCRWAAVYQAENRPALMFQLLATIQSRFCSCSERSQQSNKQTILTYLYTQCRLLLLLCITKYYSNIHTYYN